jgi:CBS domain-containing protein
MTPVTFVLPENASIAQAAALMAYEGVHRIPVVSCSGDIVGLVSSLDVLRWLGQASGYLVPACAKSQQA